MHLGRFRLHRHPAASARSALEELAADRLLHAPRHTAAAIYGGDGVSGGGGASPRMELGTPDHQHPQMIARRKQGVYAPTAPTSIVFA